MEDDYIQFRGRMLTDTERQQVLAPFLPNNGNVNILEEMAQRVENGDSALRQDKETLQEITTCLKNLNSENPYTL